MGTIITPAAAHQRPSGKLCLGIAQLNLVDGTWTLVDLDTISAGFTDGIENTANHRITPGQAGFYDVKGQVGFTNVIANTPYGAGLRLNGFAHEREAYDHSAAAGGITVPFGLLLYLSATDYLELMAVSYAGVDTVDILASRVYTCLSVQRVR